MNNHDDVMDALIYCISGLSKQQYAEAKAMCAYMCNDVEEDDDRSEDIVE